MKVVIAHDYLTQRGGAERVVLAMLEAFPDAEVVTSVYAPDTTYPEFGRYPVRSSWLSKVPVFRRDPRKALPILGPVWSRLDPGDADVVLCSSTGWAHGIRTSAPKIVYCHNPARWLYQASEYLGDADPATRLALRVLSPPLRGWDRRAATSASDYYVNSTVVQRRVRETYGLSSTVLHPPPGLVEGPLEPVPGIDPGFLLTVGRPRGYKNTGVVAEAVEQLPEHRLVAVGGLPTGSWSDRLTGLTGVPDEQMRWLYHNARALVARAYEDFGLTPIEAYSAGTPAFVLRVGGYLDTTVAGVTGEFIDESAVDSIKDALRALSERRYERAAIIEHAEQFSRRRFISRLQEIVTAAAGQGTPTAR